MKEQVQRQREYFALLAEFFKRATGESPEAFARTTDEFGDRIRREAQSVGPKIAEATAWFYPTIATFYERTGTSTLREAKALGGLRFVVGGTSQFRDSHFVGVRKALLYADTILVPDPVLPWIESPREEERFRHVLLLREASSLLRLKPLVDADLAYPAVFVFQSWEKSLQDRDVETTERILQLTTGVVGHHIGEPFATIDELIHFADSHGDAFLKRIEKRRLFVAPGMPVTSPLSEQLTAFMTHQRTWRVGDYLQKLEELDRESPARLVLAGLFERMGHQFHLMENSEELAANPMLCVEQQWHYHELTARAVQDRLASAGVIDEVAVRNLRALETPPLHWIGNIEVSDLVRLRQANENEQFRRELEANVAALRGASLEDLGRVAAQIGHAIASLIADHRHQVAQIQQKYRDKHVQTMVTGWVSAGVAMAPVLGPFIGAGAPLAVAGKYIWDKYSERQELKRASQSLMGILSRAETDA